MRDRLPVIRVHGPPVASSPSNLRKYARDRLCDCSIGVVRGAQACLCPLRVEHPCRAACCPVRTRLPLLAARSVRVRLECLWSFFQLRNKYCFLRGSLGVSISPSYLAFLSASRVLRSFPHLRQCPALHFQLLRGSLASYGNLRPPSPPRALVACASSLLGSVPVACSATDVTTADDASSGHSLNAGRQDWRPRVRPVSCMFPR